MKVFLLGSLLVISSAFGHSGDTADWGYIKISNYGAFTISTKCYNKDGKAGSWRTTYTGEWRSCHGAYVRIDVVGGPKKIRFSRRDYQCHGAPMYVDISGATSEVDSGATTCGY